MSFTVNAFLYQKINVFPMGTMMCENMYSQFFSMKVMIINQECAEVEVVIFVGTTLEISFDRRLCFKVKWCSHKP